MPKPLIYTTALLSCLASVSLGAQQLEFTRTPESNSHGFYYQWQDSQQQQYEISFSISNKVLFNRHREFKAYKPDVAEKKIIQRLKKQLINEPLEGVSVHYLRQGKDTIIRLKSGDQEALEQAEQQLALKKQRAMDLYFEEEYYHKFLSPSNQHAIKPDYLRFAKESMDDLKPLIEALFANIPASNNQSNIRGIINYILSFVQSIPYEELQSRVSSSGAGYNPPNRLIYENKGDCDSKATLITALLKPLFPNLDIAIVLVPGHALLAIGAPYTQEEDVIEINGSFYVLAEPTGPALLPLGKVGDESKNYIASGQYTAEVFK